MSTFAAISSSTRLPDSRHVTDRPQTLSDRIRDLQELARAEWLPSQATVDAIGGLAGTETVSLSQAVSIIAFGSQVEPTDVDVVERAAFKAQAWQALSVAAEDYGVIISGANTRLKSSKRAKIFTFFLRLGDDLHSLELDYERRNFSSSKLQNLCPDHRTNSEDHNDVIDAKWFNVEVDVASLLQWLIPLSQVALDVVCRRS